VEEDIDGGNDPKDDEYRGRCPTVEIGIPQNARSLRRFDDSRNDEVDVEENDGDDLHHVLGLDGHVG